MMLTQPKGYEYWVHEGNVTIREDAPEWAKKEFDDYMEQMDESVNADEDGIVTDKQHLTKKVECYFYTQK